MEEIIVLALDDDCALGKTRFDGVRPLAPHCATRLESEYRMQVC